MNTKKKIKQLEMHKQEKLACNNYLQWFYLASKFIKVRTSGVKIHTCSISLDFQLCSEIKYHPQIGKRKEHIK